MPGRLALINTTFRASFLHTVQCTMQCTLAWPAPQSSLAYTTEVSESKVSRLVRCLLKAFAVKINSCFDIHMRFEPPRPASAQAQSLARHAHIRLIALAELEHISRNEQAS